MIIFRYLIRQILSSFFAITLILLVILLSNQFVHNLNDAASGKVTLHAVMMVTAVQVPILLSYMLPLGLFLAILLTLGRLCVDHEMIVLSSCGVSQVQIITMIMSLACMLTVFDGWLMLSVEPEMSHIRSQIITQSVQLATLDKMLPGRFQNIGDDNHVLYAGVVDKSENHFRDIFVALHDQHEWTILASETIREKTIPRNGNFFVFEKGYRYLGSAGQNDFKKIHFDQFWQRLPSLDNAARSRYSTMHTKELLTDYGNDAKAAAELQWRIMNVLSTFIFALLAIPLGQVNPRQGKFGKLLPAILIYIIYANLMFAGKSWVENGVVSVQIGMWWILCLIVIATAILLSAPTLKKYTQALCQKWKRLC